ncbi:hypothetical protein D3C87_1731110 [compost metagenome]
MVPLGLQDDWNERGQMVVTSARLEISRLLKAPFLPKGTGEIQALYDRRLDLYGRSDLNDLLRHGLKDDQASPKQLRCRARQADRSKVCHVGHQTPLPTNHPPWQPHQDPIERQTLFHQLLKLQSSVYIARKTLFSNQDRIALDPCYFVLQADFSYQAS